jgi:CrcB protein
MVQTLSIAVGGALGALARFWLSSAVYAVWGRSFPYGTLAVNVLGSLLMGVLYVLLVERLVVASEWRNFWMVGLLGAFTTFSTFSLDTLHLLQQAAYLKALMNMLLSVVACVAAAYVGLILGRLLP